MRNLNNHKNFLKPGHVFNGRKSLIKSAWNFLEYHPAILTDKSENFAIGVEFYDQFPWQANYNLGKVFQKLEKFNEAKIQYEKAIAINPNYAEAYLNLGIVLQKQKKYDESINNFKKPYS